MSNRVKINFNTVNKGKFKIIPAKDIAESNKRIKTAMKEKKEKLNVYRSIRTFSGNYVNVVSPDPSLLEIEDIAHSLSNMCRFGGHTKDFHSVAEHSLWVSQNCSEKNKLAGLLHDASEAFLVDIPKPIKRELTQYIRLEDRLMKALAKRYGFEFPLVKEVKIVDHKGLEYEWENKVLKNNFKSMSPDQAKKAFIKEFKRLTENKTTLIVRAAMKIVSKDVLSPKVVRQGIVKSKKK